MTKGAEVEKEKESGQDGKLLQIVTHSLAIGAMLIFVSAVALTFQPWFRKPLGSGNGIDVDRQGRVYWGVGEGGQIQVFSPEGEFLYFFPVDADKTYRFYIAGNELIACDHDAQYRYSLEGRLLGKLPGRSHLSDAKAKGLFRRKVVEGPGIEGRYEVIDRFPGRVGAEHVRPDGTRVVVAHQPWWLWLFQMPFPVMLFFGLGFVAMVLIQNRGRARKPLARFLESRKAKQEDLRRLGELGVKTRNDLSQQPERSRYLGLWISRYPAGSLVVEKRMASLPRAVISAAWGAALFCSAIAIPLQSPEKLPLLALLVPLSLLGIWLFCWSAFGREKLLILDDRVEWRRVAIFTFQRITLPRRSIDRVGLISKKLRYMTYAESLEIVARQRKIKLKWALNSGKASRLLAMLKTKLGFEEACNPPETEPEPRGTP